MDPTALRARRGGGRATSSESLRGCSGRSGRDGGVRSSVVHGSTKAERRAARERVSTYYEAELAKLVEQVERAIARYRAGEIDARGALFDLPANRSIGCAAEFMHPTPSLTTTARALNLARLAVGEEPGRVCEPYAPRRGAGPKPERRRTDLIVVAPTRMPSLRSSPWIRTHPQPGFSRPRRSTSSRSTGSIGGRPGERRRYVHFLATSSRCQRSSVCGETGNTDHRSRGSSVLAAASSRRPRRRSGGRLRVRRNTASSCRSTAFSTSSATADEPPRTLEGVSGQPRTSATRAP